MTALVLQGLSIFIVEDDLANAEMMACMLRMLGASVHRTASSLPEALAVARLGGFDLAVVDYRLQGETALPLLNVLKSRGIPFVLATGVMRQLLPSSLTRATVLEKPFVMNSLVNAIAEVLQRKSDLRIACERRERNRRKKLVASNQSFDDLQEAAE